MSAKKEEKAIDRLCKFADWCVEGKLCKARRSFEIMCGLANNYLYNAQTLSKGNIGIDNLAKIHDIFPMLNVTWVITGKGKMISMIPDEGYKEAYENVLKKLEEIKTIIDGVLGDTKVIPRQKNEL